MKMIGEQSILITGAFERKRLCAVSVQNCVEFLEQQISRCGERVFVGPHSANDFHGRIIAARLNHDEASTDCQCLGQRTQHIAHLDLC
jgi:hypothetical protein